MELLKTLNETTYEAPKSRIGTGANAAEYVFRLSQADQNRSILRNRIKGNIDGNAPYLKSQLEASGMGSNTNLNFRQGVAIINQFKTPYYDLVVEVPMIADIKTAFGTSTEITDWSQIISEEFHRMVTSWEDWDYLIQFSQFQMLVYGIGPVYFRDETDWRPEPAKIADVLVEDGSPSRVSELGAAVILKNYTSPAIYRYIRNRKAATDLGWNVDAVDKAIIEARFGSEQPNLESQQYEWYQQKFKNADLYYGTYDTEAVRVGNVLVKEFDGKVSHHIVRSDRVTEEFLYSRIGRFDSMNDVLIPFFYDIGDGTWHSINGLGKEIYAYCQVFDRLRCREVDGAMIASSILLQAKDGVSVTKQQLLEIKNMNILPPGLSLQPTNIGQGIEATTMVRRDMESSLGGNIGSLYKAPNSPNPRKGQKQAIMEMQQTAQLQKGNVNRFYSTQDKMLDKMLKRAVSTKLRAGIPGAEEALEFRRRCKMRGVPDQALQEIDYCKAWRSVGYGSAANRLMITEWLMEHAGSFPEDGKTEAVRMSLASMTNAQTVNAIMGDRTEERNDDTWEATMENNALRTGGEVMITKLQSNVKHLKIHLDDADKHIEEVEQQAQEQGMQMPALQGLYVHLDAAGKHCYEHLKAIQSDPIREGDYKELQKRWQQMAKIHDQVKQQLEEMMQEQQKQQSNTAMDPAEFMKTLNYKDAPESVKAQMEAAAGMPRAEGDASVPKVNLDLKMKSTQLKEEKQKQSMVLDDVDTSLKVRKTNREMAEPVAPAK